MKVIGVISLERGACFGACPIYEVTLRKSGKAAWRGEAFTPRLGSFKGTFPLEEFEHLSGFVERCGFFDWAGHYRPEFDITDGPTTTISVTRSGRKKTVSQYMTDEPSDFWVLATLIDGIADEVRWTEEVSPPTATGARGVRPSSWDGGNRQ